MRYLLMLGLCLMSSSLMPVIAAPQDPPSPTLQHAWLPVLVSTTTTPANAPHTWQVLVGSQSQSLTIQGITFLPPDVWINVGDTVVWKRPAGDKNLEITKIRY